MTNDSVFRSYISDDFKQALPWPAPKLAKSIWDNFSLKGKVAVVTGGARGIGFAVAECYAQAGAEVAIIDYQIELATESAKRLSAENGVKSAAYFVDVSSNEAVEECVNLIEKDFGTVDVFVANAGIIWVDGAILNEEKNADGPDKWRRLMDVDLNAVYYCAKAVGRIFKEKQRGSFIITASMSGHIQDASTWESYIDSGLSDVLPTEVRAKWWSLIPMGREGLPQELVGAYLYLASDASTYTTGSDIRVDGGYCSV
ncbi:Sorbose reductase SOU1; AltName: Full=Sorbitol utilization protein SOU1 [Cyberlindnera jadinii]|uniref:Uncharacterized protein n=1 Tax=Cyberlindnera jadinii (strain ATCC 18201 / CBS 1600 / BCRC 20928 / JCM 3617 / NBRC 0987 / NRRL Y-1542) TaxID=983966 RepID=A0A0H5CFK8_CYBJN|nr:Sorbose reductase SOU1; AltName: Full=Sorbitol utilization protein SOU1 [Cyberlindnera jadinii]